MPVVSEALSAFLKSKRPTHNDPALLDHWTPAHETQWMVTGGDPVPGKHNVRTNGVDEWWNGRMPKNADTKPTWHDYEMPAAIVDHLESIGSTGWNWQKLRSDWVGFDFDALTGHAAGVGIAADELERVRTAAMALDYVESRRSTRGGGIHLYVRFESGVATADHTEHAALARAVLGMMSRDAGFDFTSAVDACGGNMWIWHRQATKENRGFELIKSAERRLAMSDIPANYLDEIEVVTRKRSKVRVRGVEAEDEFDEMASARKPEPLDEKHHEIIDALMPSGFTTIWLSDFHCLQTHTCALKKAHDDLGLLGVFETDSLGSDPGSPNCFCFPEPNGAWRVIRFSRGAREAATWQRGEWTTCEFNKQPDLATAAAVHGAAVDPDNGDFVFTGAADVEAAIKIVGGELTIPSGYREREVRLSKSDGGAKVILPYHDGDAVPPGWVRKKKILTRAVAVSLSPEPSINADNHVRALSDENGNSAGFVVRSKAKTWDRQPAAGVKMVLQSHGYSKVVAECLMGEAIRDRWQLDKNPFGSEYPGNRRWNLGAPQLRFAPTDGEHETWNLVLSHIGASLTPAVLKNEWCKRVGIVTGTDWLICWVACMLRAPFDPLPYLFLYGVEESGKSIFHEALSLLITSGVVSADRALTNPAGFNGELAGAILAVIEETNIAENRHARDRLKQLVTCLMLAVRQMRCDLYHVRSTLHFAQCANSLAYCPIFSGDTRIVACHVPLPKQPIPKHELLRRLEAEAPHFLATLFQLRLPEPAGRLRVAVLETDAKRQQAAINGPVAEFLRECCELDAAAKVSKSDLFERFDDWAAANDLATVSRIEFGRLLCEAAGEGKINPRGSKVKAADGSSEYAYRGIKLRMCG